LNILVVEDEETNMNILTIGLRHRGFDVWQAWHPEEGLRMALLQQPDLILMDLMFKNSPIDGIEAIKRLKAHRGTTHIPIIAQTASVFTYCELKVKGAGAEGFIRKPFRRQELLLLIAEVLQHSNHRAVSLPLAWASPMRAQPVSPQI
jgi:CheY-like chemotaxis protein